MSAAGGRGRAVLLSGAGRYGDPWHPFAATSDRLEALLGDAGLEVERVERADTAFAALVGAALLVVNAGDPDGPTADGTIAPPLNAGLAADGERRLRAALERGVGVLSVHTGVASLREFPAYGEALGGRWVRDRSRHPPLGDARVRLVGEHPVRAGLDDFSVHDERYLGLELSAPIEVVAEHEHDGARHPLVWARRSGNARVVVDLLGHTVDSYEAPGHRALLASAVDWLLDG